MNPLVSIIVPTYNSAGTLDRKSHPWTEETTLGWRWHHGVAVALPRKIEGKEGIRRPEKWNRAIGQEKANRQKKAV